MKQTLKALECNHVALQTHLRETTLMDCKEFCNVQCLYSTDVETGFPLHDLQGQWTWVYESSLQWQRTISLRSQLLFLPAICFHTTTACLEVCFDRVQDWVECFVLRVKARHTTPYIVLRAKTKIVKRTKAFVAEKKVERRWPRPLITEGHVLKQKMSVLEVFEWIKTNFNETVAAKFKGKLKSNSTEWNTQVARKKSSKFSVLFFF